MHLFYSPDLKNAEGVTPLELASSPDLQKALRSHLGLKSPEKFSHNQNASIENDAEKSVCSTEATKVNETLEEMFTDQESVEEEPKQEQEEEVVKTSGVIEQLSAGEDIVEDQSVEAVTEEGKPQGSEPLEDSVEEISVQVAVNMEVEVKVETDEETTESKTENIEHPPVVAAVSPDSNKENRGSSSLDSDPQEKGEEEKEKSPNMILGGLRKPKNPFTEIRRSTSSSRAAMLVSVFD